MLQTSRSRRSKRILNPTWICSCPSLHRVDKNGEEAYIFDDIQMVIKQKRLKHDVTGKSVDDKEVKEGWPYYVLDTLEHKELKSGTITGQLRFMM